MKKINKFAAVATLLGSGVFPGCSSDNPEIGQPRPNCKVVSYGELDTPFLFLDPRVDTAKTLQEKAVDTLGHAIVSTQTATCASLDLSSLLEQTNSGNFLPPEVKINGVACAVIGFSGQSEFDGVLQINATNSGLPIFLVVC